MAASLVAGMAFADVAVTLNARLRSNMYHQVKPDGADTRTETFDLTGNSAHGGSGTNAEDLKFVAKNDYMGAEVDFILTNGGSGKNLYVGSSHDVVQSKNDKGEYKDYTFAGNDIAIDGTYYGWMKFSGLKFTFGKFDSRFSNRYNVTAGESGLLNSDNIAKYGNALIGDKTTLDANNITTIEGDKVVALVADYTVDAGDGKLLLKGGLLSNEYKKEDNKTQSAGYVFDGAYQSDVVDIEGFVKMPKDKVNVFGVYVAPKVVENLPLAFAFTYGKNDKDSQYAVDARVGYNVSDALKLSSVIKYESYKKDGKDTDTALTVAAEASYIVNDLATVFADVGYYNYDLDGKDNGTASKKCAIKFRPGIVLNAGKSATVTAALQYDSWTKSDGNTVWTDGTSWIKKSEMSIPVIFKVCL